MSTMLALLTILALACAALLCYAAYKLRAKRAYRKQSAEVAARLARLFDDRPPHG